MKLTEGDASKGNRLIMFEGADGAGKTTQVELTANWLVESGLRVITTREPGGTAFGETVRSIVKNPASNLCPQAEFLLIQAAHAQLMTEVVYPMLRGGGVVISDRGPISGLIYQGAGRGLPVAMLHDIQQFALSPIPDCIILLQANDEALDVRRPASSHDTFEKNKEFVNTVRLAYRYSDLHDFLVEHLGAVGRAWIDAIRVVDATGTVEEVQSRVRAAIIAGE